jgi:hypothetical protein
MADQRRALHAYLTDEAHDTWHRVADESGVTVSGLVEALATYFAEHPPAGDLATGESPDDGAFPQWPEVVRAARLVDAQRRRRRPR